MNVRLTEGYYKSIKPFEWLNVPPFSVITGINGSGKSQLLELLNYYYNQDKYNELVGQRKLPKFPSLVIENLDITKKDVILLKSDFRLGNVGPTDLGNYRKLLKQIYDHGAGINRGSNPAWDEIISRVEHKSGKKVRDLTEDEFVKNLPVDFIVTQDTKFNEKIGQLFYSYFIKSANERLNKKNDDEISAALGPPPWEVLNSVLERTKLPYKLNNPLALDLMSPFDLKIVNKDDTEVQIDFSDLSSGERVIMSLVFWIYNSQEHQVLPKLILLDEPDAHLHPSMAKMFIEVIEDILVNKYNVRVIMTTHSPSTASLVSPSSLFEMKKENPRISMSQSKERTVSLLTSNLITVTTATKFVLVEDEDDQIFHSRSFEIVKNEGLIDEHASIVFIPASNRDKGTKTAGGKTVVTSWVSKLKTSGLHDYIFGLIDKDQNNSESPGIHIINRYSIENYLLDPVIIFATLMEYETEPKIAGLTLKFGEQWKLKTLNQDQLQLISDTVVELIELGNSSFTSEDIKKELVQYSNGLQLNHPKWLKTFRGHELLNIVRLKLGSSGTISMEKLVNSLRKIQLVPSDLVEIYKRIWQK